jgi:hypothetical protein
VKTDDLRKSFSTGFLFSRGFSAFLSSSHTPLHFGFFCRSPRVWQITFFFVTAFLCGSAVYNPALYPFLFSEGFPRSKEKFRVTWLLMLFYLPR